VKRSGGWPSSAMSSARSWQRERISSGSGSPDWPTAPYDPTPEPGAQGGAVSGRTLINGRYELEELPLARGGMGEVWVGRDVKLERQVAVKFIRFPEGRQDDELVRRFVRESRITARLEHPGVPAVYDVGTHEGRPYIVMQRIRGIS